MLVDSISGGLTTSVNATGRIMKYQLVISIITILTLPISYLLLKAGLESEVVYVVDVFIILAAQVIRIIMVLPMINLPYTEYLKNVVCRIVPVALIASLSCYFIYIHTCNDFIGLVVVCVCSFIVVTTFVYVIGINKDEREMINKMIIEKIKK
jgi:hypothetical protein